MITVNPTHSFSLGSATCGVYYANKGEGLPWHSHEQSHITSCIMGACAVRKGENEIVVTKESKPVLLTAPDSHEIEAIEDGTIFVNLLVL